MSRTIWLAAAGAALCIGVAVPASAMDDSDPHMKFYYPGQGFQWEEDHRSGREAWREEQRRKKSGGATRAKPWQDPDKGKTGTPEGAPADSPGRS